MRSGGDIFVFGRTAEQVAELRQPGRYNPWEFTRQDGELAGVLEALRDGTFANGDARALQEIWSSLMEHGDRFMHVADFRSYADAQTAQVRCSATGGRGLRRQSATWRAWAPSPRTGRSASTPRRLEPHAGTAPRLTAPSYW